MTGSVTDVTDVTQVAALMREGLTDDQVRAAVTGGRSPNQVLDNVIALERKRFDGEASRMRAHARTIHRQPSTSNAPTDGAAILDQVEGFLGRFIAYPSEEARVAHTLWIGHTHAMDAFDSTPRLAVLSPEPGSGKTRVLEAMEPLVPRPIEAVNVTPAYLFRKVADEGGRPTILFDEIDTVFGPKAKDNEEIRGLLNAGHRKGAIAGRCVIKGKQVTTEEIPAYCAVAMAGLGSLPETILSRAVIIRMRRRMPGEHVDPWRRRIHAPEAEGIRDQLAVWAASAIGDVINSWPEMPPEIQDRDADVWEALLAVAEAAGGRWPDRARSAAVSLVTQSKERNPSLGVRLLADIRQAFADEEGHFDKLSTDSLLSRLKAVEDAPWGDLRGKELDARTLAKLLGPYEIKPKTLRTGQCVFKGYERGDFQEAWLRYLPSLGATSVTSVTAVTNPSL